MACGTPEQTCLDMAILDLQRSKQTEAVALEQASILLEEKKLLEEKVKLQHDLWDLDKQQLEQALIRTKKEHESRNAIQSYQIAALHVSLGSYRQEALMFKLRLEGAVDEVEILSSRLHVLNVQLQEKDAQFCEAHNKHLQREAHLQQQQRLAAGKSISNSHQQASNMQYLNELKRKHELEVENLKKEQCALSLKRKEEMSALLREKNFVWDQLKRMENDFTSRLDTKKQELKCAEEALQKLELRVDGLQKAHDEKTVEATVLRINVQAVEAELLKLREDLSHLKPSEHGAINSDLVMKSAGPIVTISCDEGQVLKTGQAVVALDGFQASKLLAEKEEELKKTRKFMNELRLENQNLRLLYADLEEQLKEKQKPERPFRDNGKDATSRNLNADLDAVAIVSVQASPKACAEFKRKRLLALADSCAQEISERMEQPTTVNGDASSTMDLSAKDPSNEMKAIEVGEQSFMRMSQQSVESRSELPSSQAKLTKNRLFSSVFGIPKVVAGT
ncbi:hypothetical protein GOP47_0000726 [Adiantum capillus-veneris]|uniref:Uncharacterized protein n=1 Tax=Adiantum capillus-veneris TaxID=13818 RepID=A0A9D4VE25_ADICA|nr:hypothetical protein GOP47_0000726 [Adiantum capillus-veneris]